MKKPLLTCCLAMLSLAHTGQNLVVNPGAESLPRGTGWTIVSQGPLTCTAAPTNNFDSWTMKPIGSANYPFDHTTGVAGGTVFFSGCASYFGGPYELQQTIDVSANAALIDLGNEIYTFSGYMQTPVDNQTDQGRFVVDFLNASNAVLGASYTSSWQSFFNGSGTGWVFYSDSRIAPSGTRAIRIRMQTQIHFNQPAVNVYFDDISLTRPIILPLSVRNFTGTAVNAGIDLQWLVEDPLLVQKVEVEYSHDGRTFSRIGVVASGNNNRYAYHHPIQNHLNASYYRLKLIGRDGTFAYSTIIHLTNQSANQFSYWPNPAHGSIIIQSKMAAATVAVYNSIGQQLLSGVLRGGRLRLDVSGLPVGLYTLRCSNGVDVATGRLVVE